MKQQKLCAIFIEYTVMNNNHVKYTYIQIVIHTEL